MFDVRFTLSVRIKDTAGCTDLLCFFPPSLRCSNIRHQLSALKQEHRIYNQNDGNAQLPGCGDRIYTINLIKSQLNRSTNSSIDRLTSCSVSHPNICPAPSKTRHVIPSPISSFKSSPCRNVSIRSSVPCKRRIRSLPTASPKALNCSADLW